MPKKTAARTAPRAKKTAFVPRAALAGVFVGAGVIPLVATLAAGCGGKASSGTLSVAQVFADAGEDASQFTVACNCFDSSLGVAADAFARPDGPVGVATDAFAFPDGPLGVAVVSFEAGQDAGLDGPAVGVAADAFGGG
jgi:hypothetical protein